jgi:hypothetical protein
VTIALCFNCGAKKLGSYSRCNACGMVPTTDDELAWSLGFSDHYLPADVLDLTSRHMLAGAPPPPLPPDAEAKILPSARMNRRVLRAIRGLMGEPSEPQSRVRGILLVAALAAFLGVIASRWLAR